MTEIDKIENDKKATHLFSDVNEIPKLVNKIMKNYKKFSFNAWRHSQNFTYKKFKKRYLTLMINYL